MPTETTTLKSASTMAKELGVSDGKIKKAIAELGLVPAAKKGCCSCYAGEDLEKLKAVLK
jgi:hypothetical protein